MTPRLSHTRFADTTIHTCRYPAGTRVQVHSLFDGQPLEQWCAASDTQEALSGGYAIAGRKLPLGDIYLNGKRRPSVGFDPGYAGLRPALYLPRDGAPVVDRRSHLPGHPRGDLLQAGPLLCWDGRVVYTPGNDLEGFASQFDTDITAQPDARSALGITKDGSLVAVYCQGRADGERGLLLEELAAYLLSQGAVSALNLAGGPSASLVTHGRAYGGANAAPLYTTLSFHPPASELT